mmetsp:Transcript_5895/g.15681  ORF Transcript_5895/g.15681 Transcript_5895/m.15681 type:complete len:88 (-) Transcript_5895:1232-1495(-)
MSCGLRDFKKARPVSAARHQTGQENKLKMESIRVVDASQPHMNVKVREQNKKKLIASANSSELRCESWHRFSASRLRSRMQHVQSSS